MDGVHEVKYLGEASCFNLASLTNKMDVKQVD